MDGTVSTAFVSGVVVIVVSGVVSLGVAVLTYFYGR